MSIANSNNETIVYKNIIRHLSEVTEEVRTPQQTAVTVFKRCIVESTHENREPTCQVQRTLNQKRDSVDDIGYMIYFTLNIISFVLVLTFCIPIYMLFIDIFILAIPLVISTFIKENVFPAVGAYLREEKIDDWLSHHEKLKAPHDQEISHTFWKNESAYIDERIVKIYYNTINFYNLSPQQKNDLLARLFCDAHLFKPWSVIENTNRNMALIASAHKAEVTTPKRGPDYLGFMGNDCSSPQS